MLSNKPSSNSYAEFGLILYIYYKSAQVRTKKECHNGQNVVWVCWKKNQCHVLWYLRKSQILFLTLEKRTSRKPQSPVTTIYYEYWGHYGRFLLWNPTKKDIERCMSLSFFCGVWDTVGSKEIIPLCTPLNHTTLSGK